MTQSAARVPLYRARRSQAANGIQGEITIFAESGELSIPSGITSLEAYRRWCYTPEFPETSRICWIRGELWIDMGPEQIFTHNLVKTSITSALFHHVKKHGLGTVFGDGVLVSHPHADVSGEPDMSFVSVEAFRFGKVRLIEATDQGYLELEGPPDMVLEVVSKTSVRKDTEDLRHAY